jgi:hypothetical protein
MHGLGSEKRPQDERVRGWVECKGTLSAPGPAAADFFRCGWLFLFLATLNSRGGAINSRVTPTQSFLIKVFTSFHSNRESSGEVVSVVVVHLTKDASVRG